MLLNLSLNFCLAGSKNELIFSDSNFTCFKLGLSFLIRHALYKVYSSVPFKTLAFWFRNLYSAIIFTIFTRKTLRFCLDQNFYSAFCCFSRELDFFAYLCVTHGRNREVEELRIADEAMTDIKNAYLNLDILFTITH